MEADLRDQLVATCRRMVDQGLVAGTAGNVSVRLGGGRLLATPAGAALDALSPDDLCVVSTANGEVTGPRPTSELPLHLGILRRRDDVAAIVHTHSPYAAAHAVARLDIPFICNESLAFRAERLLVTAYAPPGTEALALATLAALDRQPGSRAVLLANHGAVAIADDLDTALGVAAAAEFVTRVHHHARTLGHVAVIAREDQLTMARTYGVADIAREISAPAAGEEP